MVILVCLRYRLRFSIALIWLLIAETVFDMFSSTLDGMRVGMMGDISGTTWLIVGFYVPVMMVAPGLTVWQLVTRRNEDFEAAPSLSN